jgi:hypothetical protein
MGSEAKEKAYIKVVKAKTGKLLSEWQSHTDRNSVLKRSSVRMAVSYGQKLSLKPSSVRMTAPGSIESLM